ncbi:hypothetical protein ACFX1T_035982 [Malus domestica]
MKLCFTFIFIFFFLSPQMDKTTREKNERERSHFVLDCRFVLGDQPNTDSFAGKKNEDERKATNAIPTENSRLSLLRITSTMSSHRNRTLMLTLVREESLFGEIVPVMVDLDLSWSNREKLRSR